jgi:peptidyl-dipeptidase A
MKNKFVAMSLLLAVLLISCTSKQDKMENKFREFLAKVEPEVVTLSRDAAIASWDASISGKDEDYARSEETQLKLVKLFSDAQLFAQLKEIKESNLVMDSTLKRQFELLYPSFLRNQVKPELLEQRIKMEANLEKKYSTFRANVNGKMLSDNEIEDILSASTNSKELEMAWKAHKMIGREVAADIIAVVKLRNQIAKELGYENYHTMNMTLSEQDPNEVLGLFDELDNLTSSVFASLKAEIDSYYSKSISYPRRSSCPGITRTGFSRSPEDL